ncbi:hypothetical protein EJ05DRAFT_250925 [Pseudovirgaria hyperparasitica]|uniref:F-box domain-containing protein n=1 Tax=Pseudovirgaria hyperparasitica TaxID=470096 RepID=A0A6A6WES9_9PEZI|nr:uncharacterized protein EJ05DRAFT_250925 [Pseudovirgaria hyperparasitica]KAF2761045.1 hypothetical protein EJ05DRAFT_250925 [Pseudovirgaria hyperparasitica]
MNKTALSKCTPTASGGRQKVVDLHSFVDGLTSYQIRDLVDILKCDRFRFHRDIIGDLPVELVIMIFSYLDPIAPFLYQRVSKRWYCVLSSAQVLDASLSLWYSPDDPPLFGETMGLHETKKMELYARLEHIQRFRTGWHASSMIIDTVMLNKGQNKELLALNSRFLAWVDGNHDVIILNLYTRERYNHATPGRTQSRLTMSEDLLLMLQHGRTHYVLDLNTRGVYHLTLPSNNISALSLSGRTIAFMMHPAYRGGARTIIIWESSNQKLSSLTLLNDRPTTCSSITDPMECIMSPAAIHFIGKTRTILTAWKGHDRNTVVLGVKRYTIEGVLLEEEDIEYLSLDDLKSGPIEWPKVMSELEIDITCMSSFAGRVNVKVDWKFHDPYVTRDSPDWIQIGQTCTYEYANKHLTTLSRGFTLPSSGQIIMSLGCKGFDLFRTSSGIIYLTGSINGKVRRMWRDSSHISTNMNDLHTFKDVNALRPHEWYSRDEDLCRGTFLWNDRFLVHADTSIFVWAFDPHCMLVSDEEEEHTAG